MMPKTMPTIASAGRLVMVLARDLAGECDVLFGVKRLNACSKTEGFEYAVILSEG